MADPRESLFTPVKVTNQPGTDFGEDSFTSEHKSGILQDELSNGKTPQEAMDYLHTVAPPSFKTQLEAGAKALGAADFDSLKPADKEYMFNQTVTGLRKAGAWTGIPDPNFGKSIGEKLDVSGGKEAALKMGLGVAAGMGAAALTAPVAAAAGLGTVGAGVAASVGGAIGQLGSTAALEKLTGATNKEALDATLEQVPTVALSAFAPRLAVGGGMKALMKMFPNLSPVAQARVAGVLGVTSGAVANNPTLSTDPAALAGSVMGGVGEGVAAHFPRAFPIENATPNPAMQAAHQELTGKPLPGIIANTPLPTAAEPISTGQIKHFDAAREALGDPGQRPELEKPLIDLHNDLHTGLTSLEPAGTSGADRTAGADTMTAIRDQAGAAADRLAISGKNRVLAAGADMKEAGATSAALEKATTDKLDAAAADLHAQFTTPGAHPQAEAQRMQTEAGTGIKNLLGAASKKFDNVRDIIKADGLDKVPGQIAPADAKPISEKLAALRARFDSVVRTPEDPMIGQIDKLETLTNVTARGGTGYTIGALVDDRAGLARYRNSMPVSTPRRMLANQTLEIMDDLIDSTVKTAGANPAVSTELKAARTMHRTARGLEEQGAPLLDQHSMTAGGAVVRAEPLGQVNRVQEAANGLVDANIGVNHPTPDRLAQIEVNQALEKFKETGNIGVVADAVKRLAGQPASPATSAMLKDLQGKLAEYSNLPQTGGKPVVDSLLPKIVGMNREDQAAAMAQAKKMHDLVGAQPPAVQDATNKMIISELSRRSAENYTKADGTTTLIPVVSKMMQEAHWNPLLHPDVTSSLEAINLGQPSLANAKILKQIVSDTSKAGQISELTDKLIFDHDERFLPQVKAIRQALVPTPAGDKAFTAAIFTSLMKDPQGNISYKKFGEKFAQMSDGARQEVFGAGLPKAQAAAKLIEAYTPLLELLERTRLSQGNAMGTTGTAAHAALSLVTPGLGKSVVNYLPRAAGAARGIEYFNTRLLGAKSAKDFLDTVSEHYHVAVPALQQALRGMQEDPNKVVDERPEP